MRHCAKCGETLNDNVSFCSRCGARVDDITEFCPRCGEEVASDERYCHKCGYALSGVPAQEESSSKNKKEHPFITSLTLFAILVVVVLLVVKYTDLTPFAEDEHITFVKNGTPELYPDITYDEAFTKFFSNRHWEYFESDQGKDIVEFTGDCMYRDAQVTATIQFVLDMDEGTFEVGYLAFNDVPQSLIIEYALITKIFESY